MLNNEEIVTAKENVSRLLKRLNEILEFADENRLADNGETNIGVSHEGKRIRLLDWSTWLQS